MHERWEKCGLAFFLLALAACTRLGRISSPAVVVWDEAHFCTFAKDILERKFYFDIHPPFGKLVQAGVLKLAGATTQDLDCAVGAPYPPNCSHWAFRLPAAVLGTLLPFLVFLLSLELGMSPAASFLAGLFVVLDNAIAAESRLGLIDIGVPFFNVLGLLLFAKHQKKTTFSTHWWAWLFFAAVAAALGCATKWTGASAMVVMAVLAVVHGAKRRSRTPLLARLLVLGATVSGVYMGLYAIHFRIAAGSNPAYDQYMSASFRAALAGTDEQRTGIAPASFVRRLYETQRRMLEINFLQILPRQGSSAFYAWPLGRKSMEIWSPGDGRSIAIKPNPVVWAFGTIGVAFIFILMIWRVPRMERWRHREDRRNVGPFRPFVLLIAFFANWLPFSAIERPMFIYHYFSALIFSLMIGAFALCDLLPRAFPGSDSKALSVRAYAICIALAASAFLLYAPGTYGIRPFWQ